MRFSAIVLGLVISNGIILAQKAEEALAFEVASVKPHSSTEGGSTGSSVRGGPGTDDPGQITISNRMLRTLIIEAYGIRGFQIEHEPWVAERRFDIVAKVPPGTTRQQAAIMMRTLLVERFKLQIRRETKVVPVYILGIAKTGLKMKPAVADPVDAALQKPGISMSSSNNQFVATGRKQSLSKMVTWLTDVVDRPVIDMTALSGDYNFSLVFDTGVDLSSDIFPALQQQLGLKLESRKMPIEKLIVDSALKVPLEN